ncbi:hypothetical protein FKW77_004013 [Venturia effusa]|uniref:Uncharacterized protein n=1 Tax=Venturia effusa TaxID=50376 RepID=A0A517LC72_9PEZI|nr:hypothetical protein FKW77_004013 [Venturia effusa]
MDDEISAQFASVDAQIEQARDQNQADNIGPMRTLDGSLSQSSKRSHARTWPESSSTKPKGAPKNLEDLLQRQLDFVQTIATSPEPAELIWIESFFPAVIVLASFGGSITFSVIPSQLENSHNTRIGNQEVRNFLALAWLFFALALGTASTGQLVLTFHRENIEKRFQGQGISTERWARQAVWLICSFPISLVLQLLVLAAFLFLALVIAAYSPAVGWTAVGFASAGIVGAVPVWFFQSYTFVCSFPPFKKK